MAHRQGTAEELRDPEQYFLRQPTPLSAHPQQTLGDPSVCCRTPPCRGRNERAYGPERTARHGTAPDGTFPSHPRLLQASGSSDPTGAPADRSDHGRAPFPPRPGLTESATVHTARSFRPTPRGPRGPGYATSVRARDLRCRKVDTFDRCALSRPSSDHHKTSRLVAEVSISSASLPPQPASDHHETPRSTTNGTPSEQA